MFNHNNKISKESASQPEENKWFNSSIRIFSRAVLLECNVDILLNLSCFLGMFFVDVMSGQRHEFRECSSSTWSTLTDTVIVPGYREIINICMNA